MSCIFNILRFLSNGSVCALYVGLLIYIILLIKETGLTGKRRSTTIAATPDDGNSQRKRRYNPNRFFCSLIILSH